MGAGASSQYEARYKEAKGDVESYESSPFKEDGGIVEDDSNMSKSETRKLKKMALGISSYNDTERDYQDTLAELAMNKVQTQHWSSPPDGPVGLKPERLSDMYGPSVSKKSSNVPPSIDPRALAKQQQLAKTQMTGQTTPNVRSRPPPPRRPTVAPNKRGGPGPPPNGGDRKGTADEDKNNDMKGVQAPSILPRPIAARDSAPPTLTAQQQQQDPGVTMGSPNKSARVELPPLDIKHRDSGASQAVSGRGHSNSSRVGHEDVSDDSDEDLLDDGSQVYDWTAYDTKSGLAQINNATSNKPTEDTSSRETDGTSALGGNMASKGPSSNLPRRPFSEAAAVQSNDQDMYATFGSPSFELPNQTASTPTRPSMVPMLAIASPSSSSNNANNKSYRIAPEMTPKNSNNANKVPMATPPRPVGKPPLSAMRTASNASNGETMNTNPQNTGTVPISSPSKSTRGVPSANQRRAANHAAPPKPANKNPHEVKETTDVKRNKAQLPSEMRHAKPTGGDWLKKRYIVNNYILLDALGAGSYGEVRLCKDRTTDHLYAVKIFSKDMLRKKKSGGTDETYFEDVKREIAVMKKLLHPNVLRLFEVLDDPKVNKMYLILEYMKKGDLINILKRRPLGDSDVSDVKDTDFDSFIPLSDLELWNIFRQVAAGIRYLHYQNIVHGDIKPQNLLIGEDGVVKIADFGIAKMLHASGQQLADASGTPAFMSPEIFDIGKVGAAFSGQLADVWALGATMFMLRFGHPPFVDNNIVNLSYKIQNDDLVFPHELESKLHDLLDNMLKKEPKKRLSLQQVIMHPWMRKQPEPAHKTGSPSKATRPGSSAASKFFAPPSSYDEAQAAAMDKPVNTVNKNDMMMSIGFNAASNNESKDGGSGKELDLMATRWGEGDFEMVDDIDSGSDDESDDEQASSLEMEAADKKGSSSLTLKSREEDGGATTRTVNTVVTERSEMSTEEEKQRAKRFQSKARRSQENVLTEEGASSSSNNTNGEISSNDNSHSALNDKLGSNNDGKYDDDDDDDEDDLEASRANRLTMDEFGTMMDTLSLQPKSGLVDNEPAKPISVSLTPALFSAQARNYNNGIGAAYHSEQGQRPSQEDRCVIHADVSTLKVVDKLPLTTDLIDQLRKFTIAGVFDGHSGWRCAQYLQQHFAANVVLHEKFLGKNPKAALEDACHQIDEKICQILRDEDNSSGSTGVIAVYDGRRHILTVANVGDSMCVLSRGGLALTVVNAHRLSGSGPDAEAERKRVIEAGGQILNNR